MDRLLPAVKIFKIGSQLYNAAGPQAIERVQQKGGEVFLDLKFHDIPNTVSASAKLAVARGVFMFNVHALGGKEMMQAARRAAEAEAAAGNQQRPLVLAVTILTSMDSDTLKALGIAKGVEEEVLFLAKLAKDAGLDGVVASVNEAGRIKALCGEDFVVVAPGIRPKGSPRQDQKRTATAQEALAAGADYIVVGRPITQASDPLKAAQQILTECE